MKPRLGWPMPVHSFALSFDFEDLRQLRKASYFGWIGASFGTGVAYIYEL
jgi:hypothetical protein